MSDPVFVDTSVLLFSEDGARPAEREQVLAWLRALWAERTGRVSVQVLNDFYLLATQRVNPPMPQGDVRAEVRRYQHWRPWATDQATVESAWSLESRFGLPFADALVVASINDLTERHGFGSMATSSPPNFQLFSLKDDPDGLNTARPRDLK